MAAYIVFETGLTFGPSMLYPVYRSVDYYYQKKLHYTNSLHVIFHSKSILNILIDLRGCTKCILSRKHHTIIEERRRYFDRVIIKDSDLDPANIANRAINVKATDLYTG